MFKKYCSVIVCMKSYHIFTFCLFLQLTCDARAYVLLILSLCFQVAYVTTFLPRLLLLILMIRALSLPGSGQGVSYYMYPDSSKLLDKNVRVMGKMYVILYGNASECHIVSITLKFPYNINDHLTIYTHHLS